LARLPVQTETKSKSPMNKNLIPLGLALTLAGVARADFTPIPLNPASFNHDPVVEATAPRSLNDTVNATMDGGTNKSGNTWFEVGYYAGHTNGLPAHDSFITNSLADHYWRMPPDYHANCALMVGHNGGGQTPVVASGTLTLTTPAAFSALSFLTASGNGPVLVGYVVHYADSTTESNTFSSLDWFNAGVAVFNAAGRVSISGGGLANIDVTPACRAFQADVVLGNPSVNVSSVDFYYDASGANNNTNNNGRALIFAIAGSTDNLNYIPVAVTGFNYDVVVEADGPQTTGGGQASSAITNNITATMDGGKSKTSNCWYEKGYYAAFPNSGLPTAGASVTSAILPSNTYVMPPSYAANCAVLLSSNETTANIIISSPAPYRALSVLCGAANGDTILPCILSFVDGTTETNAIVVRDWFTRTVPSAYLSFGRVLPLNRSLNNTPEQFVNPFVNPYPGPFSFDFRGLGFPVPRLFDAIINVANSSGAITNIALSFTNGVTSTRVVSIFALSGSAGDTLPPVFGVAGSTATGQPGVVNNVTQVKAWEGTNNIVLTSSLIAGTPPVSYQWMRAPRGGGLRDTVYSFDYSTFANVVDGGRISGATSNNLVISNAMSADNFDYLVVVSNAYGRATSAVATVMVLTTNEDLIGTTDPIVSTSGEGSPANQGLLQAINHIVGNVDPEKWLSYGLQGGNNTTLPWTGPVGFIVTPSKGQSTVKAIRFYTANDTQGRDPFDYGLDGSNDDGATWTPITGGVLKGTLILPTGRNNQNPSVALNPLSQNVTEVDFNNAAGYKQYRFTITNTFDRYRQASMQIGEIQLLGSLVPNPPSWTRQPEPNVKVFVGGSPVFSVAANGYPLPRYQWLTNGVPVPNATNSSYTFPNAQLADTGRTFSCIASNVFASTNSTSATLEVIAPPAQPYPVAVLADSPIGYWRLNETPDNGSGNNGTVANDYRGGHVGQYSNALIAVSGYNPLTDPDTAAQFGSISTADCFVGGIHDVSFAASNATVNFSIEAWVNGPLQTADAGIITKGTGGGGEQFNLDTGGSNPAHAFRFFYRDAAGAAHVAGGTKPLDGNWHHVVGVCNQAGGSAILYVDGIPAATVAAPALSGALATPSPVSIGARKFTSESDYNLQFTGVIDDVAIYNYALSPGQVLSHYYAAQYPPVITLQPTNLTVPENVSVTFNTFSYGSGTLSYQWYLSDGANPTAPISGQTASNLTFTSTGAQNGNYYQFVVTNAYGATTSSPALLTVVSGPPSFLVDLPASGTFYVGHVIQLRVDPGGTAPFTYQWQKNGANLSDNYRISGTQTNVLTIGYANFSDTGNYQVLVSGQGTTPSTLDAVTVTNITITPFNAAGAGWTMQGSSPPVMSANRLELTSGLGNTARSAFLNDRQSIAAFTASFIYQTVSGAGGADGATFCIQNAAAGAAAIGGGGGGLGYSGITPSVALALNIYDPNTRGVRFAQNGTLPAAGAGAFMPITPVLVGGNTNPIQVNVSYAAGVVSATFTDTVTAGTFTTNFTVNIPAVVGGSSAYVGFTGADGGASSTQAVSDFTMATTPQRLTLSPQKVGDSLVFIWPASAGAVLRSTPSVNPTVWSDVTAPFRVITNQAVVTVSPLTGTQFYRLDIYP
jgi:hypothetical protein